MNGNLRVGTLFGIPFYVNPSWFLVLGLVTWSYGGQLGFAFPELGSLAWVLGFVTALLLFASVVAHELGHSLVARQQGIEVNSITLFLFGGLASLGEESKTPAEAFWVAVAGPLVSLVLAGVFTAANALSPLTGAPAAIVSVLAMINLALAAFNLLPGLPLDGGNVVKALVWKITGSPYKGIKIASRFGQVLGWIGIAIGLLAVLGISNVGSIWTLLVGWFLVQNATRYVRSARVQEQLDGLTAADAVMPNSPIVPASYSIREFVNQYVIGNSASWKTYFVVNAEGQLVGEIEVSALRQIPTQDWWDVQIESVMQPVQAVETVASSQSLLDVVKLIEEKRLSTIAVLRDNGVLVGLLEKPSILQLLQHKAEANPA